jgi:arginine exporter protein ArgO
MVDLSPRLQLVLLAAVVAVVFIFIVGVFPVDYLLRRGLAITVVLIAVGLFVLITIVQDKLKRRKSRE